MAQDSHDKSLSLSPTRGNAPQREYDVPPDLNALLSAVTYPAPDPMIPQPYDSDEQSLYGGYGGVIAETVTGVSQDDSATGDDPSNIIIQHVPTTQSRELTSATVLPFRRRGRPRKTDLPLADDHREERRRVQVRKAQRAYRSRREAAFSRCEARITQLESAMRKMNEAVVSFSDHAAQTGVLISNPELRSHLRDILETCNSLALGADQRIEEKAIIDIPIDVPLPRTQVLRSKLAVPEQEGLFTYPSSRQPQPPLSNSPRSMIPALEGIPMPLSSDSPLLFATATVVAVEISQFISQLRLACTYHAYFSLRNPSFGTDDLRRKFRFLLSMLNRERLTSYFEAALHARVHSAALTEWEEIPFFSVGGAGTHYPSSPSSLNSTEHSSRDAHGFPVRDRPLAGFSRAIQEDMYGEWFDIRDLEGFLQEKRINLISRLPPEPTEPTSTIRQAAISASSLIKNVSVSVVLLVGDGSMWRERFKWLRESNSRPVVTADDSDWEPPGS